MSSFSPDALARLAQHPLYAQSPTHLEGLQVQRFGESMEIPIRYFVFRDVLAELVRSFAADARSAVAALVGSFRVDEDGPYVEVSGFESLIHIEESQSLDTLLRGTIEGLISQKDEQGRVVVGWTAHLPGSRAELDAQVVHTHMTLFNVPLQLVLLADLSSDRIASYARLPRGRFVNPPIDLVAGA
jgi:hypothetical protein